MPLSSVARFRVRYGGNRLPRAPSGTVVKVSDRELQYGLDFLTRHRELLHHFIDRHAVLGVLEYDGHRRRATFENPRAADLARNALDGPGDAKIFSPDVAVSRNIQSQAHVSGLRYLA